MGRVGGAAYRRLLRLTAQYRNSGSGSYLRRAFVTKSDLLIIVRNDVI